MTKTIKKLSEINYSENELISFKATVISVLDEGDGSKRPFKLVLKLEDSGEQVNVSSWKFEYLDDMKMAVMNDIVYDVKGQAGNYGNYGDQIRVGSITATNERSTKKILKTIDPNGIKQEFNLIIDSYLNTSPLKQIVKKLILENNDFWIWPAATKVHHAYPGGLAKHSLNVCKNAIAIWKNYQGSNCDISVIVAGALLHDIGKLQEYKKDGSRTKYGDLIGHPVAGYERIVRTALELGMDPEANLQLVILENIILSHHGKLDFGAPVLPGTLEAMIVSKADALDAAFETGDSTLDNLQLNEMSNSLIGMDGSKIFKWHQ